MPGWLTWTLVGISAWCAMSLVFALLAGRLLGRQRVAEPRRSVVVLAGPVSIRVRVRGRGRGLRKAS